MKPKLVDAHAHTQFDDYNEDRDEVISRALGAGIWMVNAGADLENSKAAVELAEKYNEGVYATVGIHPSETSNFKFPISKLRDLAESPKCVAIGECGLEYSEKTTKKDKELQAELFLSQINLAKEVKKPLVIHCRDAYEDLYGILKENESALLPESPALMHFFSGTTEYADRFLEMGFVFSFGGAATFPPKPGKTSLAEGSPRRADFASLIRRLPISAILLETDCPYVTPVPMRGQRNEPSYVVHAAKKVAELKDLSEEELAEETTKNALRFFAIGGASR